MRFLFSILIGLLLSFTLVLNVFAQNQNQAESTSLSEAKDRVIVRFEQPIGKINITLGMGISAGSVEIFAAEFISVGDNSKEYKVLIDITQQLSSSTRRESRVSVGYDELGTLLSAFALLQTVDTSASSLPNYAAFFSTQGDLSIRSFISGKAPSFEIEDVSVGGAEVSMNQAKFAEVARAIQSAKDILDKIVSK